MRLLADIRETAVQYRALIIVSVVLSLVVAYFNYDIPAMGIFKYYLCFRDIIGAGFDIGASSCDSHTFPMWGYGWLLLLTDSKPVLLLLQSALSICAVILFLSAVRSAVTLTQLQSRILLWSVALSLPWHALNSVLWPHSVATSLLWIALALLISAVSRPQPAARLWLLSGLCFGLMLNFRSDYILLPVGLLAVVLLFGHQPLAAKLRNALIWCAAAFAMMLPWGLYTSHVTGHYLQTSTNGGHVLYLGLGQLPNNRWGITPRDGDPGMAAFLEHELGKKTSSLTHAADTVLKARFRELVAASPGEYARKVVHGLSSVLTGGTYAGAFHERQSCQPDCLRKYFEMDAGIASQTAVARGLLTGSVELRGGLAPGDYLRLLLLSASVLQSLLVAFLGFVFSIVLLPVFLRDRNVAMLLLLATAGYQLALGSFTFFMRTYTSSVYILLLVVAIVGAGRVLHALRDVLPHRAGNRRDGNRDAAASAGDQHKAAGSP